MTIENQNRALLELTGWKKHPTLDRWWLNPAGRDVHPKDLHFEGRLTENEPDIFADDEFPANISAGARKPNGGGADSVQQTPAPPLYGPKCPERKE